MEIEHCYFHQFGSALGAQDRIAIFSEFSGGALTTNTNAIRWCNFYNQSGDYAVHILRGFLYSFEHCTFESMDCPAIEAQGVDQLRFENCWFENIRHATNAVELELSTVGTRAQFINCNLVNNGSTTWTRFATLGGACFASFQYCAGNVASASLTRKSSTDDEGIIISFGNNFTNYSGRWSNFLNPTYLLVRGAYEPFHLRVTGLADNPGSPETICTFTIPSLTASSQNGFVAKVKCQGMVSAVATTTTIFASNIQELDISIYRVNNGTVASSLVAGTGVNQNGGGGGWTSAPVWSVSVSGSDVILLMTSNPQGGSFTNGIKAVVSGVMHNGDVENGTKIITVV